MLILTLALLQSIIPTMKWPIWYQTNMVLCLVLHRKCNGTLPVRFWCGFVCLMLAIQKLQNIDLTSEVGELYFGIFIALYLVWRVLFLAELRAMGVGMLSIISAVIFTPFVRATGLWNRFNAANAIGIVVAALAWYMITPTVHTKVRSALNQSAGRRSPHRRPPTWRKRWRV